MSSPAPVVGGAAAAEPAAAAPAAAAAAQQTTIAQPKPAPADKKKEEKDNELDRLSSPPLERLLDDLSLKSTQATAVVYRVVLTGGPCGGKTTAMGTLTERFQALGWRVFRVPEAATMLLSGGHSFANLNRLQQYQFQAALLKLMLSLEEAFISLARSTHEKCIVLCDRGTMDCRSYMPEDEWEQLVAELGTSTLALRDERYDCVVHLVTAANGAAEFYTLEGHAARSEPPEYARELDERVKNNWVGHPYFHVIDNNNSEGFRGKIQRVMSTICNFVGLQGNVGMSKRKFLVSSACVEKVRDGSDRIKFPEIVRYQRFDVEHDYILRPGTQDVGHQLRLRRRGLNGNFTYSYTLRYPDLLGQRVELKRLINRREYFDLLLQRDPQTQTVRKKRYSFIHQDQYYELDQFVTPHKGLYLLEFYAEKDRDVRKQLPSFFKYEREVTNDPRYAMYNLAKLPPSSGRVRAASVYKSQDDVGHHGSDHSPHVHNAHAHKSTYHNHHLCLSHSCASAPTSPQVGPAMIAKHHKQPSEHKL